MWNTINFDFLMLSDSLFNLSHLLIFSNLKGLPSIGIYKTQFKYIPEPEVISRVQNKPEHLVSDGDWSRPRDVPTAVFL